MYRKKITYLLIVSALVASLAGCSAARRNRTVSDDSVSGTASYLHSDIFGNNISNSGFFISKARVEIFLDGSREKFTASVRKDNSGKWLASIRSFAGIEVLRVYADRYQVVILDRLGRKATVMDWEELSRNFGLTYNLLPVLVGDMPVTNSQSRIRMRCGKMNDFSSGLLTVMMIADCEKLRPGTMILNDKSNGREITVAVEQFSSAGGVDYSSVIEVREKAGLFHVKMSIDNLEVPWLGEVEFSIPSNYRRNR